MNENKISERAPRCEHCHFLIRGTVHAGGSNTGLQRCGIESGLPYDYNAHAEGTECAAPCRGARASS